MVPVHREDLFAKDRYLAGSDARRRAELDEAVGDPSARAIWAARGGYGCARLLDGLAASLRTRPARWLIGFSDITALHCAWAQAGIASLHGANVTTLGGWSVAARDELFALLFSGGAAEHAGRAVAPAASARGVLLGGNLTVLASLAGSGFIPSWRGAVVLLEDVGEKPYRLDRSLTQLRLAGAFAGVSGVAVGQLSDCEEPAKDGCGPAFSAREVVTSVLGELGVPLLDSVPVGHDASSRAVVLGADAVLDGHAGVLRLVGRAGHAA